jgi:tetratricopeptide (TPR) repeat protein
LAGARALFTESLALAQAMQDRLNIAMCLGRLSGVVSLQGEWATARALAEESLAQAQELGAPTLIEEAWFILGYSALQMGNLHVAEHCFRESLNSLAHAPEKLPWIGGALAWLAEVARVAGRPERAARVLGALETLRGKSDHRLFSPGNPLADVALALRIRAAVEAELDPATFAAEEAAGRALSWEEAIAEPLC